MSGDRKRIKENHKWLHKGSTAENSIKITTASFRLLSSPLKRRDSALFNYKKGSATIEY
jgi:hypothetical protein